MTAEELEKRVAQLERAVIQLAVLVGVQDQLNERHFWDRKDAVARIMRDFPAIKVEQP